MIKARYECEMFWHFFGSIGIARIEQFLWVPMSIVSWWVWLHSCEQESTCQSEDGLENDRVKLYRRHVLYGAIYTTTLTFLAACSDLLNTI